ncbi:unnamed protein product [Fraxinus pennsylvanica]|uniref:25S rRNA (uridine-N(3))-methyltransferase BMT5-like domain-containing protein n=1 Tax=Fraxinus pennsylvanica TaxID=56036 RepID=A0AAD2DJD4_9LAMI|nr:unnamed protein product [Fraxinus pennsylvanica]
MGILQSIYRFLGSNGEDEESSGEVYPILDHHRKPSNGGYFRASLSNIFKNLLRRISNILLLAKVRKPEPILPVVNPVVSTRNNVLLQIQEISSPSSDLSLDSSPGATYVPPSDLEWQRNYSDIEIESHINVDTYSPPSDLEWQRNYSDIEIESHVNVDTYSPPSDLVLQRDNSSSENEVYANAAWRCSLAHKNAFDVVDSAVLIENETNQLGQNDSGDKAEEERVIKCLVVEGKWIKHYNSYHRILLVGEGDFSFSASLAVAFGSVPNMIATSLDSVDFLKKNYKRAMSNIGKLRSRECIVMHGIDATKVASHQLLGGMTFDRIIYNFPFAGFFKDLAREAQLRKHRRLVSLFLKNAKEMIGENGEIHITHKINDFHIEWKLESVASSHRLRLIEAVEFDQSDYKGYSTKCGFGGDNNFNCYPSKTYKFGLKRA